MSNCKRFNNSIFTSFLLKNNGRHLLKCESSCLKSQCINLQSGGAEKNVSGKSTNARSSVGDGNKPLVWLFQKKIVHQTAKCIVRSLIFAKLWGSFALSHVKMSLFVSLRMPNTRQQNKDEHIKLPNVIASAKKFHFDFMRLYLASAFSALVLIACLTNMPFFFFNLGQAFVYVLN